MTSNCLHVRIKATAEELRAEGIECEKVLSRFQKLVFAVEKRVPADHGRTKMSLIAPWSHHETFWIYEDMTEPI